MRTRLIALAWLAQAATALAQPSSACPAPAELGAAQLYGEWRAEFDGLAGSATLRLEASAEHADGVFGRIRRDAGTVGGAAGGEAAAEALVAGDVDEGEFTLEESSDGRRIEANWSGTVSEGSCGREIRGTWSDARGGEARGFVLRKQSPR